MLKILLKKKNLDFTASWKTAENCNAGRDWGRARFSADDYFLGGDIKKARDELLSDDVKNYDV
jgi:hypothetical protein